MPRFSTLAAIIPPLL
ncbi:hypothetical protein VCHC50A1_1339, partial [Vibrio cholerae HC-50A1]